MKENYKKLLLLLLVVLGGLVVGIGFSLDPKGESITETPLEVVEIDRRDNGLWSVPKDVIGRRSGKPNPFVLRLKDLRVERLTVEVEVDAGNRAEIQSDDLKIDDLLILHPWKVQPGQAVAPISGIDDERLIRLTLEAGSAAVMAEYIEESVRFISPNYRDSLGFDFNLIRRLIERAYEEFDQPLIELAESSVIQINGFQAVVQTQMKLTAIYNNRRNYLIGDRINPNNIILLLDKSVNGWKVSCCKQMKCPVVIANELSGIVDMGYKEARRLRRFAYEYVSRFRSEAGNEDTRDYFKSNEWRDHLDKSGMDNRSQ